MKHRLLFLLLICFGVFSSCSRDTVADPVDTVKPVIPAAPSLNDAETAYLMNLRDRGGLKVATMGYIGSYEVGDDGCVRGLTCRLLQALGETFDIPVHVQLVENFDRFFTYRGEIPPDVKTDPAVSYTPDILRQVDLVAFELTETAWRSKLMTIVPFIPTRVLVVNRRGEEVRSLGGLQGKKITVAENTSHEVIVEEMKQRLGLDFRIVPIPFDVNNRQYLKEGLSDCAVDESQAIIRHLAGEDELNISLALTGVEMNGWAVSKENDVLASILEKFFTYAEESGILDTAFREGYGISLERYYSLINYREDLLLEFNTDEEAFLEDLRKAGGLTAAIDTEQSVYEIDESGIKGGLHYNLALSVAQALQVPIRFRDVTFHEFFMKDGEVPERVKNDPEFSYTPDLLKDVDVYIGTISPLPWRKKFLSFVGIYPTKLVYITRKDYPKRSIKELEKPVFSLLPNTTYESWLNDNFVPSDYTLLEVPTGEAAVAAVSDGRAEITISDANLALARLADYDNITFYPTDDSVDTLSWAVAKDNEIMRSILAKTLDYLQKTLVFNDIWYDYYGVPFAEYLDLLSN